MRVITGIARGHKLKAPKGLNTRPTTDRVKESLFNIIGDINNDAKVLDLFSGTGNIGIEFLSRGADTCFFIDNNIESIKIIKENLKNTKLDQKAQVYRNSTKRAIDILKQKNIKFNYIFLDPPYKKNLIIPTLESIDNQEILEPNGLVIVEHDIKKILPNEVGRLVTFDLRKYGRTAITFLKYKEV